MSSPLKTRQLKRSTSQDYELYRVALEWGLIEPIVIESKDDMRSEPGWRERVEPYHHQISNLISFCRRLPVTLLSDDVGLGKTISAGLIASELISRGRVSKILIVCPKLIMPQWEEELRDKFNIASVQATGSDLLTASPPNERGAVITTYNSARLYLEDIVNKGFEFLILDEAHKLRNLHAPGNSPQVAKIFRKVLTNRNFNFVLMLTATPIQNRLWDIYSLIDLLAVARGHENPFGTKGMFAREYIEDHRDRARQLKIEKKDAFRSIVYSHMSRIRRTDAKLSFPERIIQQHSVKPTSAELDLIRIISQPIQDLDKWSQMSVARALISSPHALAAELQSRAKKGTISPDLASEVRAIADSIGVTAKQRGLGALVEQFRRENPSNWRMVVFTTRLETQTTIETYLTSMGISCSTINGSSGSRNQDTLSQFKKNPPDIHVIISTEAGSEGVNLQAANVVVNYDLPWNPMVVEQRIGRVQRLASIHKNVCVFNMILQGTFEEYVVGRLMEKLLMASHAIGDVDALLDAAGIDEEDGGGFEEKIRALVMDALAGKDIKEAVRLQEKSIQEAKAELESAKQNINDMLGKGDANEYKGPRCPKLDRQGQSLDLQTFVERAVSSLGGKLASHGPNQFLLELNNITRLVTFDRGSGEPATNALFFGPGNSEFERLVSNIADNGCHAIDDLDVDLITKIESLAKDWCKSFKGSYLRFRPDQVFPCFTGTAMVRTRVTVAHDSYERVVDIDCMPDLNSKFSQVSLDPLAKFIFNPEEIGFDANFIIEKTKQEKNISEFCRFYKERLVHELKGAGDNERFQAKIKDEFTPRLQTELVGLKGQFNRRIRANIYYNLGDEEIYMTPVFVVPAKGEIAIVSPMSKCSFSNSAVPTDCLGLCEVTGQRVIKHFLKRSELSGRMALAEKVVTCAVSGKQVLVDEVQKSAVSGQLIFYSLLEKSDISSEFAEPEYIERCAFTQAKALKSELVVSEISGKRFRADQQAKSALSGKIGHPSEFILCSESNQYVAQSETESCEVTGQRVIPSELVTCSATGKKAVKKVCIASDVSGKWLIESAAMRSDISSKSAEPKYFGNCEITDVKCLINELIVSQVSGKKFRMDQHLESKVSGKVGHPSEFIFCAETAEPVTPSEAEDCEVTGRRVIPSELVTCSATGKKAIKKVCIASDVSGKWLIKSAAMRSDISGKFAEPEHFSSCEITSVKCLTNELMLSQISGKKFRNDQHLKSKVSGKSGHSTEFIFCGETNQPLAVSESEKCENTGKDVVPGILESCEVTGKRVLPTELVRCEVTRKKAIMKACVLSSISHALAIESAAIRSSTGKYCLPSEAVTCSWTGQKLHREDASVCQLTNIAFKSKLLETDKHYFGSLVRLLNGVRSRTDRSMLWDEITILANRSLNTKSTIESAELSPDENHLAVCIKIKELLGLRVRYAGFIYSINDRSIAGNISLGKRENGIWILDQAKNSVA